MAERYVGVSGVGTPGQQSAIESFYADLAISKRRQLLLGVKATTKIQVDETESRKGRNWFPVGDELTSALQSSEASQKVLQLYADDWTDLDGRAIPLIERSLERAASWVDGLQYDLLPWFTEDSSLELIQRYAHGEAVTGPVILQCHGDILRGASPEQVIERLKRVEGYVTHVLFDASEGRGLSLDPDTLSAWIESVEQSDLDIGVAVAGGLGSEDTGELLIPVLRRFDDISWDAESKLHRDNVVDVPTVESYLYESNHAVYITETSQAIARDVRTLGEWSIWLAHIDRQPTYLDGRFENDAEHASMLARVSMMIALKYFPELDAGRVAMFSTVHDDVEGYDGDFPSLGASVDAMAAKAQREAASLERMRQDFSDIPQYVALIDAYEEQREPEARFVKVMDKCMPAIMNLYNRGKSVAEEQNIMHASEYMRQAEVSSRRLDGHRQDWGILVEAREALIEMIRTEVFDPYTGEHLEKFKQ